MAAVDTDNRDKVIEKASFALNCAAEKLTIQCTGRGNEVMDGLRYDGVCTSYGVRGCDKQAEFLFVWGTGWVNNTGVAPNR